MNQVNQHDTESKVLIPGHPDGFEIQARSCTLFRNYMQKEATLWKNGTFFRVPIFQRPYSWGEQEVKRLLNELLNAFFGRLGGSAREPMFVGTMQLEIRQSEDRNGYTWYHNIIDGQQRITTLILIIRALELIANKIFYNLPQDYKSRLETLVGGGVQQGYLRETLQWDGKSAPPSGELNRYQQNLFCIRDILMDDAEFEEENQLPLFVEYLLSQVYFLIIETRAGLSKTLQIFNAINTAGLDLNGGDIFKIRFYEYLRKNGSPEEVFGKIVMLYDKIDQRNKKAGEEVADMEDILAIAKYHVVTEACLPESTRLLAGRTFFDRFFDTSLGINKYDGFDREKCQCFKLDTPLFDQLIEVKFNWHTNNCAYRSEGKMMDNFIWWTRFSAYYNVRFLFCHRFSPSALQFERFIVAYAKLLVIHSIIFERITASRKNFLWEIMDRFSMSRCHESPDSLTRHLNYLCATQKIILIKTLNNDFLAWMPTSKKLACRLIAMLDEIDCGPIDSEKLCELLFDTDLDIEHIESSSHRDSASEELRSEIDRLGNLIVMERSDNRSFKDGDYATVKREIYSKSSFTTVRRFAQDYPVWNLEAATQRRQALARRLAEYLCGPNDELDETKSSLMIGNNKIATSTNSNGM